MQIGNAITEKMVLDVLLPARDRGLYHADHRLRRRRLLQRRRRDGRGARRRGAGSTRAPLKYAGLSYTEIWITEAQERMVLAVPPAQVGRASTRCARAKDVEATVLGTLRADRPAGAELPRHSRSADLSMHFLHDGRPPVVRAGDVRAAGRPVRTPQCRDVRPRTYNDDAARDPRLAQRRQQGVDHPPVRPRGAGRQRHQAAGRRRQRRPERRRRRAARCSARGAGSSIACGINPRYGDLDPYAMAAGAIDEAVRNCVAVGADPARIAILDNFCWGNTDRPETLGSLVRAAAACRDVALAYGTPFISGKDSLNNEFRFEDASGRRRRSPSRRRCSSAPSARSPTCGKCVTMDLKEPGNLLVPRRPDEGRAGRLALRPASTRAQPGGAGPPQVDRVESLAKRRFRRAARGDRRRPGAVLPRPERRRPGGRGGRDGLRRRAGATLDLVQVPTDVDHASPRAAAVLLFSESNTRFLCEVRPADAASFESLVDVPRGRIGEVTAAARLRVSGLAGSAGPTIDAPIAELKGAWQRPMQWQ